MAFLDNSGDIILDAVLTDEGRKRMAAGDGSFRIVKFALGDDEIDYALYQNSNSAAGRHPSGSAYYDLSILQSPILEAFTNNTSNMNSKLISYAQNDLLYLPVILLNNVMANKQTADTITAPATWSSITGTPVGGYLVTADNTTSNLFGNANANNGVLMADDDHVTSEDSQLVFDEGLNTTLLSAQIMPSGDPRVETEYIVEVDNRLFNVMPAISPDGNQMTMASPSFIDDDNIASYYFALNRDQNYFALSGRQSSILPYWEMSDQGGDNRADNNTPLGDRTTGTGRYGSRFGFRLNTTLDVQTSTTLFSTLGGTITADYLNTGNLNYRFIDTVVRVTGYMTGYRVDIPLRILKNYT
mgnify:CR=1 FL=1